ncbi:MAG: nucleoside hydrolase [Planctomycetaceae bacterium]|nr:nucleoside hydrolase [Planctomycetaceae bacterium]
MPRIGLLACLLGTALLTAAAAAEPVGVIFDTDMGNDVDDALALGMLHSLHSRGQCRLLAVTLTKDHRLAGPFVDAVNHFYGRPEVAVGVVRDGKTREDSKFLPLAVAMDDGKPRYPHTLQSGADATEAVALLRQVLSKQPDRSVVIVQVGFSTNIARLLETKGDAASPLSGSELITQKVRELAVMAGAFKPINGNARFLEYNVVQDIPSAKAVAEKWPTPIVWSGFEIGIAAAYPATSIERDYSYVVHHPLAEAYRLYNPPPHNRPTWDLTAALYAVCPDRGYFDLSAPGRVTVEADGFTKFAPADNGPHRTLILPDAKQSRLIEALVQLSSQPPDRR